MNLFLTRRAKLIIGLILLGSFLLMMSASWHDATIVDELAHIPAGYSYLHFLDYRLNPEHPPLLKALAALPLQFLNLRFPTDNTFWTTIPNGEWGVGGAFLFGLGNDPQVILRVARIMPILITLLLILLTYLWAKRLYGKAWALLPATLVGFSPIILAHGHYVTTDIAAALGALIALFSFSTVLQNPSYKAIWIAGIAFGIAELMKFSMILLIPVFLIIAAVYFIATMARDWPIIERSMHGRTFIDRGFRYLGRTLAVMAIGALLVYISYAIVIAQYPAARQISDTTYLIGPLAHSPCNTGHITTCIAKIDLWSTSYALTRPIAQYLLGALNVAERLSQANVTYFLGHVSAEGSWAYFPTVYALKEPLPILIIVLLGLLLGIIRAIRAIARKKIFLHHYIIENVPQFSMMIFVALYWAWSMKSPLNIGVRHIIPTLPLFAILAGGAIARSRIWFKKSWATTGKIVLTILLIWLGGEVAFAGSYYLSYFNELGGRTANGYEYVTDSNYDWGQDMLELKTWMDAHPEVDRLALDFFGGSNPQYYLGNRYVAWQSSMGNPAAQNIHWFAISINNLQDAIQPAAPNMMRNPADEYQWLLVTHPKPDGMGSVPPPDYRIGTTIFIYKM